MRTSDINLETTSIKTPIKVEIVGVGTDEVQVEGNLIDAVEAAYNSLRKRAKFQREWGVELKKLSMAPAYIKVRLKRKGSDAQT